MFDNILTIAEYAAQHNTSAANIRQRIARGLHPEAFKKGDAWLIPRDAPYKPDTYHKNKKDPRD